MLLGDQFNNPLLNFGIGLLSNSGPTTQPVSFGQALAAGARNMQVGQQQKLRNELIRDRLTRSKMQQDAIKRQQNATAGLRSLLGRNDIVTGQGEIVEGIDGQPIGNIPGKKGLMPAISTPQGQQEMLGLLGDLSPQTLAQGLLTQVFPSPREKTSLIRNLEAAGIDPASEEGQAIIRSNLNSSGNDALTQQVKLQSLMLEMQDKQADLLQQEKDRKEADNDKLKGRMEVKDNYLNTLSSGKKILDALDVLEDGMLEPGQSLMELRPQAIRAKITAQKALGKDASKEERQLTAYNTMTKLTNDFAIKLFDTLETQTNATFGVLRDSIANMGVDPTTNRRIIQQSLLEAKQVIDREGIKIPKAAEEMLEKILKRTSENPANVPVRAPVVLDLSDLPE